MLHIVLLVLKIIGIVLLVILGLLLVLLLAVLLAPLRYKISGSYYGELKGSIKITWLLHMVSAVISYQKETSIKVRILGIPVYHPGRKKAKKEGKEILDQLEPEIPKGKETIDRAVKTVKDIKAAEPEIPAKPSVKTPESPQHFAELSKSQAEPPDEIQKPAEKSAVQGKKSVSPFKKIWNFIKNLPDRIRETQKRVKAAWRRLIKKVRKIRTSTEELKAWFYNPENQEMMKLVYRHAKAILRHGLPKRVKGSVTFGFDDPYTTGQALAYAGMLYPLYGKNIMIQPVFDRVIFECEGTIKGRIRVGTVLLRLFRAYRNKTLKALIKKWMG